MNRHHMDSDTDEPSEDDIMRAEVAQLQRKYRTMQNDHRSYKEATKRILSKQNMLIDSLKSEQNELLTCMSKMETTQNRTMDESNTSQLMELAAFEKDYQALIQEETEKSKELDEKFAEMEKQITEQRKKMGGVHISTAKHIANCKNKAVLENRLDKSMVQFNQQLAINQKLRSDIDHLRRERSVFDNLYKKLSKELNRSKREMSDVIDVTTQAFEQRDEARTKMTALRERNDKDHQQHIAMMRELTRIICHDDKIKEFMSIKSSDRRELKEEEDAKKKKMRGDSDKSINADLQTIKSYEDAFKKIQELTGENDLDVIVDTFINTEDTNFALFNYVNELNSEVENLTEEVESVRADIEKFRDEDSKRNGQHCELVKQTEDRHTHAMKNTENAQQRLKEVNKVLDSIMSQIYETFKRVKCDARPIEEMLGDDSINAKNVMVYMGLIEQKTSELLNTMHYFLSKKCEIEGGRPPVLRSLGGHKSAPVTANIQPPSTEDDLEFDCDENFDTKPMTKTEIQDYVLKGQARRCVKEGGEKSVTPSRSPHDSKKPRQASAGRNK